MRECYITVVTVSYFWMLDFVFLWEDNSDLSSKCLTLPSTAQLMLLFLILKKQGPLFAWRATLEPCTFIHQFNVKFMRACCKKKTQFCLFAALTCLILLTAKTREDKDFCEVQPLDAKDAELTKTIIYPLEADPTALLVFGFSLYAEVNKAHALLSHSVPDRLSCV